MTRDHLELAYAGGFLDGEGCINLTRAATGQYRMQMVLTNTDRAIIEWFQVRWGGNIHMHGRPRTNATDHPQPCFMLWWTGRGAAEVLRELEPYVRVKREQLLNALAFQAIKAQGRPGRATTPHLLREQERLYKIGRQLNSHDPLAEPPLLSIVESEALQLELLDVA